MQRAGCGCCCCCWLVNLASHSAAKSGLMGPWTAGSSIRSFWLSGTLSASVALLVRALLLVPVLVGALGGLAAGAASMDAWLTESGARSRLASAVAAAGAGAKGTDASSTDCGAGWLLLLVVVVVAVVVSALPATSRAAALFLRAASMYTLVTYRGAIGQLAFVNTRGAAGSGAWAAAASALASGPTAPNHMSAAAWRLCSSVAMMSTNPCWLLMAASLMLVVVAGSAATGCGGLYSSSSVRLPNTIAVGSNAAVGLAPVSMLLLSAVVGMLALRNTRLAATGCTACCAVAVVVLGRTNLGGGGGSRSSSCGGAGSAAAAAGEGRWGRLMEAGVLISWAVIADGTKVVTSRVIMVGRQRAGERESRGAGVREMALAGTLLMLMLGTKAESRFASVTRRGRRTGTGQ